MDEPKRPRPKYLDDNHDRALRSRKHEQRLSQLVGGKRLAQSGAKQWSKWSEKSGANRSERVTDKGDISAPDLHIEHKRTDRGSMGVQKEWLDKVSDGARAVGKDPALFITFEKKGRPPSDWALIPMAVLLRLMQKKSDES